VIVPDFGTFKFVLSDKIAALFAQVKGKFNDPTTDFWLFYGPHYLRATASFADYNFGRNATITCMPSVIGGAFDKAEHVRLSPHSKHP
jgi:hypothetical protein